MEKRLYHTLPPIYQPDSKILILGSFPSVVSRKDNFYYAHPQNKFWKLLQVVFDANKLESKEDKIEFLKKNKIALYDVIQSCTISGSKDSSIKNIQVNNITEIIEQTNIRKIYTTGRLAFNLYKKYLENDIGMKATYLPSPSAANASMTFNKLLEEYSKIKE